MGMMKVLIALLAILIVANARVLQRRSEDSNGDKSLNGTSEEPVLATSEEPLYETTEQPEYPTTAEYNSTGYDYLWNNTYTDNYDPQTYAIQCAYTDQTTIYLDEFEGSIPTFDVSSNTLENTTYPNNRDCTIQFVAGPNPVWLSVYLEQFDLENSTRCSYDFLCIKGAKFCGRSSYPIYLSYGVPGNQTFTMKFHTDSTVTREGFRFKVYIYESYGSSYSYEPYGIISNPNEIYNYREVTQDNYVDYCLNENDPIYDTTSPYNSYQTTRSYYENSEQVVQCANGVTENYYYLSSNNNNIYDPSGNSYNMNDYFANNNNRYVFTTPNFGAGTYGNNTSCKVHFYTSSVPQRLSVYFSDFDVESAGNCVYDYLCVNGVNLCSNWEQYKTFYYYIPAYSTFTVNFGSDISFDRLGVKAFLTFDDSSSQSYGSYEATSGDGSQESSVVYSYTDLYSYQDRCSDSYQNPTTANYPTYYTDYNTDYSTGSGDSNNYRKSYINAIENDLIVANERIEAAEELVQDLQ